LTVHFAIRLGERRRGAAGAPPLPTRRCFGAVRESPQPRGLEYANFDCQEQVNAGQKVAQLGHAIGTKIIRGASNFFAANILRIALLERHQSEDFGMRTAIPLTVLAAALACSLASAPAHARARVFVASYGNDANPCTFASFNRVEAYHNGGSWDRSVRHFFRGMSMELRQKRPQHSTESPVFTLWAGASLGARNFQIHSAGAGSIIYVGHSMVGNRNEDTGALLGSFGDNDTF